MSRTSWSLAAAAAVLMAACGGGGGGSGGSSSPTSASTISGTAATGAAMAGAQVEVKDVSGTIRSTTTSVDGGYSVSVNGMTAPFLIKASGMDGTIVYSAALTSDVGGTINVTPLTSIVVADATDKDLSTLYSAYGSTDAAALTSNLSAAITALLGAISPVATELGTTISEAGLLRGTLAINQSGLDTVMDALTIAFSGSVVTISDKSGAVIASADLSSAPLSIDSSAVSNSSSVLNEYATATRELSAFLGTMSSDCGHPVLDANGLGNDDLYTAPCTAHMYDSSSYLNEGETNPAVFSPGWGNIAEGNGTVSFSNPIIFGYDVTHGYKVRYTYVAAVAARSQIFQSEGYFKNEAGTWKFRGDQQYLLLDVNAHRKATAASTAIDTNVFKLFVSTGAGSWGATSVGGQSIDYVVVKGAGLPDLGLVLETPTTGPDGLPAMYACMSLKDNPIAPACPDSAAVSGETFQAVDFLADERQLANMHRYVFIAYHGTVGSGVELYRAPYWLPLRYEYAN